MKKKILSFLLMISILSSLFSFVASATEDASSDLPVSVNAVYSYYDNEGNVKAAVRFNSANEAGTAFFAVYDEGKLINIGQATFEQDKKAKMITISGVDESYIGLEARIFCWGRENSLIPISVPFSAQITDYLTELVRRLNAVSDEIDPFLDRSNREMYTIFNNTEKKILKLINECIDDAVANHASELNDDFIRNNYSDDIETVDTTYDGMTQEEKEAFKGRMVSHFTIDNLIWLADTLGIDVEQFGIDKSDYV